MLRRRLTLAGAAVLAALAPLVPHRAAAVPVAGFPGWPSHHEGRALAPVARTPGEVTFEADFPGRIGRFADGVRAVVIRFVAEPTRRLHPTADCYRASGYEVTPLPPRRVPGGAATAFEARRGADRFLVLEHFEDASGRVLSDVSQWYWAATLGSSPGPWWCFATAERL